MSAINSRRAAAIALGVWAGSLAACSLSRPTLPIVTYGIEPQAPPRASQRNDALLRIAAVRVASAYSGAELVYRLDEARFAADYYHCLLAPPGAMLGAALANWLDAAGPMRAVLPPDSAVPARYVLEVSVSQFYGDFRPGRPPTAVLRGQASLIDTQTPAPKPLLELAFDEREPLPAARPEALVLGYDAALRRVAGQLQPALAAAFKN